MGSEALRFSQIKSNETVLDAKVFEAVKRFSLMDESLRKGTITEARLVQNMIQENKLIVERLSVR